MAALTLFEMVTAAVVIATAIVSTGILLRRLIDGSGPGSVMWHD